MIAAETKLTAEQIRELIFDTIDSVIARGNAGVSVSFMADGGAYINVYPYNDSDDEEEKETV